MLQPAAAAEVREKMDAKMDQFIAIPGYVPHDILSGAESPSKDYGDCGDSWMWGINYLTRSVLAPNHNGGQDLRLATELGTNFSMRCPDRLPDATRTFARPGGGDAWPRPSPVPNFVWADGSFMAMVLPARLAVGAVGPWAEKGAATRWIGDLVAMHVDGYRKYLRDPADGLYRHGFNYLKREASCCKWGRANGWLMMSRVEVLLAAKKLRAPRTAELVSALHEHASALCTHADARTGLLHQLVNESASFLETSSTAMSHWAITTAVQEGILPRSFAGCITTLWRGVASTVDQSGAVSLARFGVSVTTACLNRLVVTGVWRVRRRPDLQE